MPVIYVLWLACKSYGLSLAVLSLSYLFLFFNLPWLSLNRSVQQNQQNIVIAIYCYVLMLNVDSWLIYYTLASCIIFCTCLDVYNNYVCFSFFFTRLLFAQASLFLSFCTSHSSSLCTSLFLCGLVYCRCSFFSVSLYINVLHTFLLVIWYCNFSQNGNTNYK
jgi:hypothetical protein